MDVRKLNSIEMLDKTKQIPVLAFPFSNPQICVYKGRVKSRPKVIQKGSETLEAFS